jgi:phage tail sheath gpL-like
MANIQTVIQVKHNKEVIQTIKDKLLKQSSNPRHAIQAVRDFFHSMLGGNRDAQVQIQVNSGDAVAAHGTITFSSFTGLDTFTIGSETFTCENSGASGNNQFNKGGTDTLSAAAAVAKINAHPNLLQTVVASNVGAVITVTCTVPGRIGNYIGLAISAHGSVSASTLASGADATTYSTQNTYHLGL